MAEYLAGKKPLNSSFSISRRAFLRFSALAPLAPNLLQKIIANAAAPPPTTPVTFVDVAQTAGITFQHDNAASAEKYLIETMGSGCGWIDYDQNGLLDLYLVNGAATNMYKPKHPLHSALYRNNGDGTFTDITVQAGVGAENLFGMGVAVGDYDNDGYPDLLVLGYGRCISITTMATARSPM